MPNPLKRFAITSLALFFAACPRTDGSGSTLPSGGGDGREAASIAVPEEVTEESLPSLSRRIREAPQGTPGRQALRRALLEFHAETFSAAREGGDEDRAYELFAEALLLLNPDELTPSSLGEPVAQMARGVIEIFEPRGDEARVLAAVLALTLAEPQNEEHRRRYAEIARWSESARQAGSVPTERVLGLVDVYERVAAVIPLAEPVDRLASLYVERHHLLQTTFGGPERTTPPNTSPTRTTREMRSVSALARMRREYGVRARTHRFGARFPVIPAIPATSSGGTSARGRSSPRG